MSNVLRRQGGEVFAAKQRDIPERIPYITAWSAEESGKPDIVLLPGNQGIAYRNETRYDRDERGILLQRTPNSPGQGNPKFGVVHATRQRLAMTNLLCQVCGNPADENKDGVLWLLQDNRADWPDWPNRMGCTEPPVCAYCAELSTRVCPALRHRYALVRVRSAPIAAVHGALYAPSPLGAPRALDAVTITFEDPMVRWVLASHVVRELRRATLVN